MKTEKYQLVEWHEARMNELQYPSEIVWELRAARTKFLSGWTEFGAHGWPQTNSATLRGAPAIG